MKLYIRFWIDIDTFQVAELVLVREIIPMELVVVLDMEEEGALELSMECWVKVVKDMVAPIFLVSWEVELRDLMIPMDMLQEEEWLVSIFNRTLKLQKKGKNNCFDNIWSFGVSKQTFLGSFLTCIYTSNWVTLYAFAILYQLIYE